jgi:hypothetical protein
VTKGRAAAGAKGSSSSAPGVVLRESRSGGVVVCGLEEVQVLDATDIFRILEKGIQQRRTAATLMNKVHIHKQLLTHVNKSELRWRVLLKVAVAQLHCSARVTLYGGV